MKETKKMNLICRYIPSRYFESTINDGFLFSDYNNWKYEEDEKRLLVEFPMDKKELRLSFSYDEWRKAIERIKIGSAVNEEREIEIRALAKEKGIAVTSSRVNEYESWSKAVVSRVE